MPRQARIKSNSGIYHVMLRGINHQQIFEQPEDYYKFLEIVKEYKEVCEFELFAYCLMGNHIHLLIKENKEPIEQIFKRIGGKFVYWYNIKYERSGHLFQDRFKSEPVETDEYLLTVIRYIHQNPLKAELCKNVSDYQYSSFMYYETQNDFIDSKYIFEIIDLESFIEFNKTKNDDKCLDIEKSINIRVTDEQARQIIKRIAKCESATEFQKLDTVNQNSFIKKFKEKGLSIRQISRLTGISFGLIRKI